MKTVKVKVNGNWIFAGLVHQSGTNEKAIVQLPSGKEIEVEHYDIQRFVPLPEDDIEPSNFMMNSMFDEVKLAVQAIMPDEANGYHNSIQLTYCIMEVQCIGVIREVIGWEINTIKHIPQSWDEPDIYDTVTVQLCPSNWDAVCSFLQAILKAKLEGLQQSKLNINSESINYPDWS
jgi:hypothetical protein